MIRSMSLTSVLVLALLSTEVWSKGKGTETISTEVKGVYVSITGDDVVTLTVRPAGSSLVEDLGACFQPGRVISVALNSSAMSDAARRVLNDIVQNAAFSDREIEVVYLSEDGPDAPRCSVVGLGVRF